MARFIVRVELHNANWNEYQLLHAAMTLHGLGRQITSSDGVRYDLPPAEYYGDLNMTRADVLARVKIAAGSVKPAYSVLVTESIASDWFNLPISQ
ncbi:MULTISPECIES: hypothetical protein [unclassified Caballeronia]|uniref:hypothetical protein n=1 Tax=unclassified Caballeronia TaxID=2646786 RepID=UPI002028AA89|nr:MULTISPECIES: hypothetical protein [unclassified Caballeronia]